MDDDAPRRAKVHALAGLLWPLMILASLVLLGRAARGGRETFIPWVEARFGAAPWGLAFFGTALVLWVATAGALRFQLGRDPGMQRLRRFLAIVLVPFAAFHGWLVWGRVAVGGADARFFYANLVDTLSHTATAWIYAIGIGLTALQLEQAARVAAEVFRFPRRDRDRRWYFGLAIIGSVMLLFFAYDGLGAFVVGRPLFGGGG